MAVFTDLTLEDADRITRAHGLGAAERVTPIPAGSVNSNFFVDSEMGRRFVRIYEEQGEDGVAYEWALVDHLAAAGIPVPARVAGPGPGELRVAGKPVGVFEIVGGEESCQAAVGPARAAGVGRMLARVHAAVRSFPHRRAGRFTLGDVAARLEGIAPQSDEELAATLRQLRQRLAEVREGWPPGLPEGVIHGDLFRDNVRWAAREGQGADRIVALIDWESASDGALVYDLMVCVLAWCFAGRFDWELARAMARAYEAERPLEPAERKALRLAGMAAAVRFTTTRITDFQLREGIGERVHKDYRRFRDRLEALAALAPEAVAERLLG